MHKHLMALIEQFEDTAKWAKEVDTTEAWERLLHMFVTLGVSSPVPGECMCVREDWDHILPLHREHLEFNSKVWMTLQIHDIMAFVRRHALREALEDQPAHFTREYALELLEHFLHNRPSITWVETRYVAVFSQSRGNPAVYDASL